MFRRRRKAQTCHLKQYVDAKLDWPEVEQNLRFVPKSDWRLPVHLATKRAFRDAALLLASELYERAADNPTISGRLAGTSQEAIMIECVLFSASSILAKLNPQGDTLELAADCDELPLVLRLGVPDTRTL